jgi:hypothetical protein
MTKAGTAKAQRREGFLFFQDRDGRSEKENQPSGGTNWNHAFSFSLRKQDHYKQQFPDGHNIFFLCSLRLEIGYRLFLYQQHIQYNGLNSYKKFNLFGVSRKNHVSRTLPHQGR